MSDAQKIPRAFSAAVDFALAHGALSIKDLPGCWERAVDKRWWIAINGSSEERRCSKGAPVPPYSVYVEYNGWPAGVINPAGGWCAAGSIANEDALIAALEGRDSHDAR